MAPEPLSSTEACQPDATMQNCSIERAPESNGEPRPGTGTANEMSTPQQTVQSHGSAAEAERKPTTEAPNATDDAMVLGPVADAPIVGSALSGTERGPNSTINAGEGEDIDKTREDAKEKEVGAGLFLGLDDLLSSVDVYEVGNYTFGRKERESRSFALQARTQADERNHLSQRHKERGLRRSVAGLVLVHQHRFAHVLLLQRADGTGDYALPGGRLRPGESDEDGLARKLRVKLTPDGTDDDQLDIGERLCNWYRIDFSPRFYPYIPAHVTKPKEELHVYSVSLPEKFAFSVPKNMQLVAIPLYDLFDNAKAYGNVIAAVPSLISRFHVNYC